MSNQERARLVWQSLLQAGVQELVLCAGSRNSPLVALALSQSRLRCWHHFEERSASFFALGRIQALGAPVAVCTTSGTAVAELLPACIEAHYSRWPLVLLTADRPERFAGSGSPQSIEQKEILGSYVESLWNVETQNAPPIPWSGCRPWHINVAFEEPLMKDEALALPEAKPRPSSRQSPNPESVEPLVAALKKSRAPLVLLGRLPRDSQTQVAEWVANLGAPVYAEAQSGLRTSTQLKSLRLEGGDALLKQGPWDLVLRLGSVPTCRFWRDLEENEKWSPVPVFSLSQEPFSGLARPSHFFPLSSLELVEPQLPSKDAEALDLYQRRDQQLAQGLESLLIEEPLSEAAQVRRLSEQWPEDSLVFVGNSLPIRQWDLAATWTRRFEVHASRGANGIDGQLSVFLGLVQEGRAHFALLGDLTLLYDTAGAYVVPQMDPAAPFQICVLNNQGGRIFERLPAFATHFKHGAAREAFLNPHEVDFQAWAQMWKLGEKQFQELRPQAEASARFWQAYARLVTS